MGLNTVLSTQPGLISKESDHLSLFFSSLLTFFPNPLSLIESRVF